MRKYKWIIPFFLIMISVSSTIAQQCLSIVNDALELASVECSSLTRNEACYGYSQVTALPNVNPNIFKFEEQGDIAPFEQIAVIELSPFDEETGEWGVVVARLQAQLPDTLPGQNVTVVMFGSVSLQNEGVSDTGVQAFRLSTGIGTSGCLGLPPDGLIIETPEDASFITFEINGTEITLGSTAFVQTFEDEDGSNPFLRIGMVEGLGFITADGETTRIEAGQQTAIPLDANFEASGAPSPTGDFSIGTLGVMLGFIESLEFTETQGNTSAPEPTAIVPTEIVETAIPEPCTVSTTDSFSAGLRVGPGENRTQRAWMQPNVDITVTGVSDDGEWWQLDKFEAFPAGANSVVELWVRVDEVAASGDCDQIGTEDAPPIIAPPQEISPTPDETEETLPIETEEPIATEEIEHEPIIQIWVDDIDSLCSEINWYIEYVSAVYLVGASANPIPLAGISGSYEVCPRRTTTYYVRVVYTNGTQQDFPVTLERDF